MSSLKGMLTKILNMIRYCKALFPPAETPLIRKRSQCLPNIICKLALQEKGKKSN